ncbi:hypothetical protein Hanom_Chr16g01429861 [Helianthus anomalus]
MILKQKYVLRIKPSQYLENHELTFLEKPLKHLNYSLSLQPQALPPQAPNHRCLHLSPAGIALPLSLKICRKEGGDWSAETSATERRLAEAQERSRHWKPEP